MAVALRLRRSCASMNGRCGTHRDGVASAGAGRSLPDRTGGHPGAVCGDLSGEALLPRPDGVARDASYALDSRSVAPASSSVLTVVCRCGFKMFIPVLRPDSEKPFLEEAADALEAWIRRSGLTQGAIFRRIRRGETIGEPLAPAAVRDIVKVRAALAGLPETYAAHSLRPGFVTEAARQNVPLAETMALTGHTSAATLVAYFRAAESARSAGARMFTSAAEIGLAPDSRDT